jgi:hypothetical protein
MRLGGVVIAALIIVPACTQEDIVLGTVPDNGTVNSKIGARCETNAECGDGTFCNRHYCNAAAGNCEPYPASCADDEHPVCGCDGITYFNDCLRRANGVPGSDAEECEAIARTCDPVTDPCPAGDNSFCALLSGFGSGGPDCKAPTRGKCWVVPPVCPANGRSDRYDECDGPGSQHCVKTCDAIRSKKPYVRASICN